MAINLSTVSKVLSNGKKVLSTTERFRSTVKTTTKILDNKGQIIRERVKRTFPGEAEFRMQTNSYTIADNSVLGIKEEFARIRGDVGQLPYIQKGTWIKLPNVLQYKHAGIEKFYDSGKGFYA